MNYCGFSPPLKYILLCFCADEFILFHWLTNPEKKNGCVWLEIKAKCTWFDILLMNSFFAYIFTANKIFILMYIMYVIPCLFSTLSHRVGTLQISVINVNNCLNCWLICEWIGWLIDCSVPTGLPQAPKALYLAASQQRLGKQKRSVFEAWIN